MIPTLMNDFEGFKTSVKEGAELVKTASELELEIEPEGMTELLQSHDKNFMTLKEFQRKWFLEIDFIPGKNAVKIIEMTTNNLEYYINLVIKAEAGLKGLNPIFKILLWVKCYQIALHITEKLFMKRRVN